MRRPAPPASPAPTGRRAAPLLFALLAAALPALSFAQLAPTPGWARFDIPATGSYAWRYVPASLDPVLAAPLVVFLHGAGAIPEQYRPLLEGAAEETGAVLVLPKSTTSLGWGLAGDLETVQESLRRVRQEVPTDPRRISLAGHSAGGAYAYLVAYATTGLYNAVFTLAAPAYPVDEVADSAYTAPIHMYYGTLDPNYTGGAYAVLEAQWDRLGVPWEVDVGQGRTHNELPRDAVAAGVRFLVDHPRPAVSGSGPCIPGDTVLCLEGGRFQVEAAWQDFQGGSGAAHVVPGASRDSGLLWFFGPDNWELLVKVLDGCSVNGRFWVFAAATTNVEYTLTVTDTKTGDVARYENPLGRASPAITDTGAFDACP